MNIGNGIMGMTLTATTLSYPNLDVEITFYGNIAWGSASYRVIVWYPALAKDRYNIIMEISNFVHLPSPYTYSLGFGKYNPSNSIFILALKAF